MRPGQDGRPRIRRRPRELGLQHTFKSANPSTRTACSKRRCACSGGAGIVLQGRTRRGSPVQLRSRSIRVAFAAGRRTRRSWRIRNITLVRGEDQRAFRRPGSSRDGPLTRRACRRDREPASACSSLASTIAIRAHRLRRFARLRTALKASPTQGRGDDYWNGGRSLGNSTRRRCRR